MFASRLTCELKFLRLDFHKHLTQPHRAFVLRRRSRNRKKRISSRPKAKDREIEMEKRKTSVGKKTYRWSPVGLLGRVERRRIRLSDPFKSIRIAFKSIAKDGVKDKRVDERLPDNFWCDLFKTAERERTDLLCRRFLAIGERVKGGSFESTSGGTLLMTCWITVREALTLLFVVRQLDLTLKAFCFSKRAKSRDLLTWGDFSKKALFRPFFTVYDPFQVFLIIFSFFLSPSNFEYIVDLTVNYLFIYLFYKPIYRMNQSLELDRFPLITIFLLYPRIFFIIFLRSIPIHKYFLIFFIRIYKILF